MATNKIQIDEGSTTNVATNTITEDAVTKHINRTVLNNSSGTEISIATETTLSAISTKQDTGNSSLSSIDGKLTDVATQTTLALIKAKTDNLDTALSEIKTGTDKIVTGGSTLAEQQTQTTEIGATNETAPATDTATSGLNGRLQRIAQRISSLIALLPTALGAGGGLKVDGSGTALPVSGTVTATPITGTTVPIAVSSSGDTSIVSAVSGKKIKVVSLHFVSRGTVTVKWKLGATYMGEEDYIVNTGISSSSSEGVLVTGVGEALSINLSASVYVGGSLTYIEV